ncbi:uncharacterized protein LOC105259459 isoform X2 [Camponotus floridanus]|uniref:uncharacterized protein LOC105259459 isoform X2 n=1 Tax=Camponotus floridanus TaxID=104421 RepID=UPI00059E75DB|nr:uncharacterized protein LOC105259459 isoform X2 [Camponotus floridanus]
MLSINMRIFKTVLLIVSFGASVRCLPVAEEPSKTETSSSLIPQETTTAAISTSDTIDYYDQRQNGSENYRIHVDGVVFVFAPVEALLLAGATDSNLPISNHSESSIQLVGDKPNINHNKTESAISKTIHKPALRLANFLAPLIRRIHHERGMSVH